MSSRKRKPAGAAGADGAKVARRGPAGRKHILEAPMEEIITPLTRVLIIGGSTMCGKTNMLYSVLKFKHNYVGEGPSGQVYTGNNIQFGLSFSRTEAANGNFGGRGVGDNRVLPHMLAKGEFDRELLGNFNKYQIRCAGARRAKRAEIIGDDLMSDSKAVNCPEMDELLMNMRNAETGASITSHGVKKLNPDARENFQVIIAFDVGGDKQAEKLYDCFFSAAFRKKRSFLNTYRRVLRTRFQAIVIDTRRDGPVTNRVFKYKPPKMRPPHLCEAGFWEIAAVARARDVEFTAEELFDVNAMRRRLGLKAHAVEAGGATAAKVKEVTVSTRPRAGTRGGGAAGATASDSVADEADADALNTDSEEDEDERGLLV